MFPQRVVEWMLDRGVYLQAGSDTSQPDRTVDTYVHSAGRYNLEIKGRTILVFGYGGSFGVALGLLERCPTRHPPGPFRPPP